MSSYGDNKLRGLEPHARFQCEMLRTAGLLTVFGILNLVPGVYDLILATIDGQDWSGDSDTFPPVVLHLSALIQVRRRQESACRSDGIVVHAALPLRLALAMFSKHFVGIVAAFSRKELSTRAWTPPRPWYRIHSA